MNRRRDYKTALLIDAAIYAASSEVRTHAAGELVERPLPHDFALRIVSKPNMRRHQPPAQPTVPPA